jgi:hypothetical protein
MMINSLSGEMRVSGDEIRKELDRVVQEADTTRADELDGLARLRTARTAAHAREAARLSAKLGPDHPRVAVLEARVAADPVLTAQVQAEAGRARTQPVSVGETGWAVHGHVRTADGRPVPGLTAALYDDFGRRVEGVGWGCTDAAGYFIIRLDKLPVEVQPVRLHLVDAAGQHVYVEPRALTPAAGEAVYLAITLDAGDPKALTVCNPPPDDAGAAAGGTTNIVPPKEDGTTTLRGSRGEWTVVGTVTDADGAPLAGVTVSLYDRDLFFDDRLGQTTTDAQGRYRLVYHTGDFRDFIEARPDLYVRILDAQGKELHTQPARIRAEAGRTETLDVRVEPASSGRGGRKRK